MQSNKRNNQNSKDNTRLSHGSGKLDDYR